MIVGRIRRSHSSGPLSVNGLAFMIIKHAGDYGDIVYAAAAFAHIGFVDLVLHPCRFTRATMSEDHARQIIPLMASQAYIRSVSWCEEPPECVDGNYWRHFWSSKDNLNLVRLQARHLGISEDVDQNQWLHVDPLAIAPVVCSRTFRYRDRKADWKPMLTKDAIFVGYPDEHEDFEKFVGRKIDCYTCSDLLHLARVLAGAKLFIGNQSCAAAIAEGLKLQMILEMSEWPVCRQTFDRPEVAYLNKPAS